MIGFATRTLKGSPTTTEVEIDKDTKFSLLSNSRRRAVITILLQHDTLGKSELGEMVAARENDTTVKELDSATRKTVLVSLHQSHLQKLRDANVIEWDVESDTITAGAAIDQFAQYVTDDSGFGLFS